MALNLIRFALLLFFAANAVGQNQFPSAISDSEAAALAAIIEDDPNDIPAAKKTLSPNYPLIYGRALPIPPVKQPKKIITNPVTGKDIRYYEIEILPFQQQVYPNLRPAQLVGYDGISPGPTFLVPKGTETVVRIMNNASRETSVHLHGSPSRAPFDGWANDVTYPGQVKDYYWPNYQSARMLWYHDHAMSITAENAYFGQAGAYILTDSAEDALGLPSGYGVYDIPLVLSAKQYNSDGTLHTTFGEDTSVWGDVLHVNGMPWPFLNVEPRKYRFRFLNSAVSRSFALYFIRSTAINTRLPFQVIASDAGLLENPVQVSNIYVANAERYEVVFDFTSFAGQTLELRNLPSVNGIGVEEEYENTDKVMKFVVSASPVVDSSNVPTKLRDVPFPTATSNEIDHHFRFHRTESEWRINGIGFEDAEHRVLAKVPRGTVEIWELENSSGGWTHPIHVHLVDFKVLQRSGGDRSVLPYEAVGLKDVVWLGRHETVVVEAHYAPWNGVYMFHCHNLIHEDQDMMAAFNVTNLPNLGYNETTDFGDPMDPRWRAHAYSRAEYLARTGAFTDAAITQAVQSLAIQQPYSEVAEVEQALDEYWATHDDNSPLTPREERASVAARPILRYRRI